MTFNSEDDRIKRPLLFGIFWRWVFPPRHEHCIIAAKNLLRVYAEANGGAYPTSSKGWGDALLKLNEPADDPEELDFSDHGCR